MGPAFMSVRKNVPVIHVFQNEDEIGKVTFLKPSSTDRRHCRRPSSYVGMTGIGTKENPFQLQGAADVSPHYTIIDLWHHYHYLTSGPIARTVYIKVNDWILEVLPTGVRAQDGVETRFT